MKKFFKPFVLAVAALAAVVACNKETEIVTPDENGEGIVLNFVSEKPDLIDADTRTVWNADANSIYWSSSDKIRVAVKVGDNWQNATGDANGDAKLYESKQAGVNAATAQFTVPTDFKTSTVGTYKFYAIYPSSCTGTTANSYMPSISVTIPATQAPVSGNSFDAAADVMVASSVGNYTSIPMDPINLEWNRIVAHGDITLKKLPTFDSDEVFRTIEFIAQEGADLAGFHYVNITDGSYTLPSGAQAVNKITVDASNISVNAEGNIRVWFVSLPFTAESLSVVITTNKHTFTKTYSNISKTFMANRRNTLGISMFNAIKEDTTEEQLIADGVYAIALMGQSDLNKDIMMTASTGSVQSYSELGTTYVSDKLSIPAASVWRFSYNETSATYTILSLGEEKYLSGNAGNANLTLDANVSNAAKFTITSQGKDSDNNPLYHISVLSSSNERWIAFNYNGGTNPRFALYKDDSSYKGTLRIIPAVANDYVPTLTFTSTTATVSATAPSATFYYTAQHLSADPTVAVTTDDDQIVSSATVNASNKQIVVALNPNTETTQKTATLTVSCEGIEEDITLTVNQNGKTNSVEDVITRSLTGITGSSYTDWSGKSYESGSGAVYAGNSAGGNSAVQLRSDNSNSGVVSTTSGGKVQSITVTWESHTPSGRTLNVYGKNTAYTAATDLYDSSKQGTLLGTLVCGSSTVLTVTGDYEYVGLRSASGAIWLSEIRIAWSAPVAPTKVATPSISCENNTVSISCTTDGASIYYTTDGTTPTASSTPYTAAFAITGTVTVKAIATKTGLDDSDIVTEECTYVDPSTVKTYTYTITTSDFKADGYGKDMTDITATATDGSGSTLTVSHKTSNAGRQTSGSTKYIQFKKTTGKLYNTTDLGTVVSVTLNGASGGTSVIYKGSSVNPTTEGSGGFFTIQEAGTGTLTCTSITVTFTK